MPQQNELQQQLGRVEEELITKIRKDQGDPASRALAKELVQLILEVHGAGLERMLEITAQSGAAGMEIIDRFGEDESARSLLLLYGLHPVDLGTRVEEGLESIRHYLQSRNAGVELLSVTEGAVHVRLLGNAHGCTANTLKAAIEEALYKAAPDLVSITVDIEAEAAASVFIPLSELRGLNGSVQPLMCHNTRQPSVAESLSPGHSRCCVVSRASVRPWNVASCARPSWRKNINTCWNRFSGRSCALAAPVPFSSATAERRNINVCRAGSASYPISK